MDLDIFKEVIRKKRKKLITKPKDLVNKVFVDLGFNKYTKKNFFDDPTSFIVKMRLELWDRYKTLEKSLNYITTNVLIEKSTLINKLEKTIDKESIPELFSEFLIEFDDHIYELAKSNTNSRRSRAGKELEEIFHKLLIMCGIRFDPQGEIGKAKFANEGLSKLVDSVVPGVIEYKINKHQCALISMKTSLRERWQEVSDEKIRTRAHLMYLFTLDQQISDVIIENLYENNVCLVVLDFVKENNFKIDARVLGLKDFLQNLIEINNTWNQNKMYDVTQMEQKRKQYKKRAQNKSSTKKEREIWKSFSDFFKEQLESE